MPEDEQILATIAAAGVPVLVPAPTLALAREWVGSAERLRSVMQSIDDPARRPFVASSGPADAR